MHQEDIVLQSASRVMCSKLNYWLHVMCIGYIAKLQKITIMATTITTVNSTIIIMHMIVDQLS